MNVVKTLVNQSPGEFCLIGIPSVWAKMYKSAYAEARQLSTNRLSERVSVAMEALTDNGNWADGNPFFAANRQLSAKSGVITNAVTDALSKAAAEAAIAMVLSWKLHSGLDADVTPRALVVGPANHALAKLIVEADLVVNGGSTVSNVSTATMLKVFVSNSLIGEHANKWYLFCEKSGMMPIGVQQRKLPVLTRMDRDSDPNVFMKNEYYYGTDSRGEGFLTLPFLAYAGGFTTVPDAGESGGGEEPGGGG
jgi:phage major head subunit gpT-like protein